MEILTIKLATRCRSSLPSDVLRVSPVHSRREAGLTGRPCSAVLLTTVKAGIRQAGAKDTVYWCRSR